MYIIPRFFLFRTQAEKDHLDSAEFYVEAAQIFTTIFHKYNERISPVKDEYPKAVPVNLEVSLVHVLDMDERRNVLDSIIDLRIVSVLSLRTM